MTLSERFWAKVDKNGPVPEHRPELGACWLWTGARHGSGYGNFKVRSYVTAQAHRVSLSLTGVAVPDGLDACHHCDTPLCVRPSHLFVGTVSDNLRDAYAKGRMWPQTHQKYLTHCKRGHELSGDNLYTQPDGHRNCRTCQRMHMRAHDAIRRRQKAVV